MEIIIECILNPGVPCDSILNYTYVLWFVFGIVLIVLEFFIPGVFIIFFGLGALVTSLFHYLFILSFGMQITTWIVAAFAIMLFGAKFLKDLFPSEESYEPTMKESVSGR
ncbi:MAG TPA: NfeD family protein, partial [Leptospiraceae bacterium]|nr:NfeD family protein [Leptospiraceae bacterium]